jgi:serine/threonine protein kinase
MALGPGTRLGAFEIISVIGAGGMGEVYRARDTKLDRDVAIKVLPSHLSSDPDALARFEREAKAVAALSHRYLLTLAHFWPGNALRGTNGQELVARRQWLFRANVTVRLTAGG